jgi:DNA-binding MarR family transcriptional regulator
LCNHIAVPPRVSAPTAILDELGRLLRQLTRLAGGADDEHAPPLTASQRIALVELGEEGPLRVNDLAHLMGTSAATASRAVDALEAHGLVTRSPAADDRRALSIELSRRGRTLLDERLARAADAFAPATAALSAAERQTLLELLARMTQALRDGRD